MNSALSKTVMASLVCCATPAVAQSLGTATPDQNSMFVRDRSITVADRMVPGYARIGVNVGAFNVRPEVTVGALYNDNLYATDNGRVQAVALTIAPAVNAVLDAAHARLLLAADAQINRFTERTTENSEFYNVRGEGRYDLGGGLTIRADAGVQRRAERRSDPGAINTSIRPILTDSARAGTEIDWESGRLLLRATGGVSSFRFRDGRLADGTVLPQSYRDRDLSRIGAQADYALTPDVSFRVQATYGRNDYNHQTASNPLDRSSDRYEVLGGVSFEFTDLLRGEIGVGYIEQKYDDPTFRPIRGMGGRAQIEYLVTPLTTVTVRAARTVEEAGLPESPSYLHAEVSLTVDHELYRNVIVSGTLGYADNKFRRPDRSERRPAAGAGIMYRLSGNVMLTGRYDYLRVSARPADVGRSLRNNVAMLGFNVGL